MQFCNYNFFNWHFNIYMQQRKGWFIDKLRWYEIIIFLIISISFLSPEFVLNKFYPKYNYKDINQIH